jgi:hypothetical protein
MKTTTELLDSIDQRLREAKQEIETLTAARAALDGRERQITRPRAITRASRKVGTASAPAARKRRRKVTRAPEVVPAGRLERLLSQNGGLTTTALAEQTNGNRDQVLTLLRELEAAGRVRRSGQRRGTRWHAITDEDRIRERAAELASRRKRPS